MKFWIDACLSPTLEDIAHARDYEATSNRRQGELPTKDSKLYPIVLAGDWVFVTNNAEDFRELAALHQMHPGLLVMPQLRRATQQCQFAEMIDFIEQQAGAAGDEPRDWMFMREVVCDEKGHITHRWMPDP